ncbi:MAG: hypothetical protein JRJ66_02185 [Deltaproteobacteria bacterium]|nr:hypothetical protein [Deltaproteobacteria bacterium]
MGKAQRDEMVHQVRNGLLVIRGLCLQIQRGQMSQDAAFEEIRRRCIKMEAALDRENNETRVHHHPSQPD